MVVSERSAWRAVVLGLAAWVVVGGLGLPAPGPGERPVEIRRIALTGDDAGPDVEWFAPAGDLVDCNRPIVARVHSDRGHLLFMALLSAAWIDVKSPVP